MRRSWFRPTEGAWGMSETVIAIVAWTVVMTAALFGAIVC